MVEGVAGHGAGQERKPQTSYDVMMRVVPPSHYMDHIMHHAERLQAVSRYYTIEKCGEIWNKGRKRNHTLEKVA